jgi:hypothetical protein
VQGSEFKHQYHKKHKNLRSGASRVVSTTKRKKKKEKALRDRN